MLIKGSECPVSTRNEIPWHFPDFSILWLNFYMCPRQLKGNSNIKNKWSSNERARKIKKNELSLTSMRQMVLEISFPKFSNLSKMDVAILKVFSHRRNTARQWKMEVQYLKSLLFDLFEIFSFDFKFSSFLI